MKRLDSLIPFIIVATLWLFDTTKYSPERMHSSVSLVIALLMCILFDINISTFVQAVRDIAGSDTWVLVYEHKGKRTTGLVQGDFKMMRKLAGDYPEAVGLYKSGGPLRRFYWIKKTGRNKRSML